MNLVGKENFAMGIQASNQEILNIDSGLSEFANAHQSVNFSGKRSLRYQNRS